MSRPDQSISPRILESARQEFLSLGFEKASLSSICRRAGVTTGALYKRYAGKEALFRALVEDTVRDLKEVYAGKMAADLSGFSDAALMRAWYMDEAYMLWWFSFLEERREGFVLLLRCSEGTEYGSFQHDWAELMTEGNWKFYQEAKKRGLARADISKEEFHVLLSAFWETIYEPFIHGFSWEQMKAHCHLVCRFFDWYKTLDFPETELKGGGEGGAPAVNI